MKILQLLKQMVTRRSLKERTLILGVIILLALNLYTFVMAYPETYTLTPGINSSGSILAKDFSAYYIGSWRLWNIPSRIYAFGALSGQEPVILPYPEAYKYLPSFSLIISPLLLLSYQRALIAFDVAQFALLPAIAYLLYKLLSKKHLAVTFGIIVIALLLPFPTS